MPHLCVSLCWNKMMLAGDDVEDEINNTSKYMKRKALLLFL
jgi:hypothetical protein